MRGFCAIAWCRQPETLLHDFGDSLGGFFDSAFDRSFGSLDGLGSLVNSLFDCSFGGFGNLGGLVASHFGNRGGIFLRGIGGLGDVGGSLRSRFLGSGGSSGYGSSCVRDFGSSSNGFSGCLCSFLDSAQRAIAIQVDLRELFGLVLHGCEEPTGSTHEIGCSLLDGRASGLHCGGGGASSSCNGGSGTLDHGLGSFGGIVGNVLHGSDGIAKRVGSSCFLDGLGGGFGGTLGGFGSLGGNASSLRGNAFGNLDRLGNLGLGGGSSGSGANHAITIKVAPCELLGLVLEALCGGAERLLGGRNRFLKLRLCTCDGCVCSGDSLVGLGLHGLGGTRHRRTGGFSGASHSILYRCDSALESGASFFGLVFGSVDSLVYGLLEIIQIRHSALLCNEITCCLIIARSHCRFLIRSATICFRVVKRTKCILTSSNMRNYCCR